jgi:hypothetical protein
MKKQPQHISLRAGVLALLLYLTACLLPAGVSMATPPQQEIPPHYQQVAENEQFQLYVDDTSLAFKLLDKRSGYVWHSGIDELVEGDRLNSSWQAFAKSGISIDYLDERGTDRRVSIANTESTLAVTAVEQGFSAQVTFQEYGITVGVVVQLEADGVRVEVPFASIAETNPDFRLARVYIYPFLGATRGGSIPGYMLLPDGSGSLIRFADSTRAVNMFYGRYYGDDLGMIAIMPYDPLVTSPYPMSMPVFGMAHGEGQNAFVSIVEDGAAYGELQVHPAGIITNFNFLYHAFIYNQPYFQATNRSGAGVTTVQQQPNQFDAVIRYRFLTGDRANYVGMARAYQQYLLDEGRLQRVDAADSNIGIRLEFLAGDKERVLLWDRFIPMTTIAQMQTILDGLQLPNAEVIYYGWQPLGASTMPPTTVMVESGLGTLGELRALAENITASSGHFSLYLEPQMAFWEEGGYSVRSETAMAITNIHLEGFNRLYGYYFSFDALQRRYRTLSADIAEHAAFGLALDGIGWMLYSDFRQRPPFNREATIDAYQTLLAETHVRLGLYRPNDYLFGLMEAYYDIPVGDNGYIYTSKPVPFLPTVLAGYIPYYGGALNFSSNRQDDLLRHVEFGIYPSYFLTHEPTTNMLNTRSSWIYTSSYDQWGAEIRDTYQWLNALLGPVRGQPIVAHERLAEGIFATTYANGQQIIVNYTDLPYVQGGISVNAKDAVLMESSQ